MARGDRRFWAVDDEVIVEEDGALPKHRKENGSDGDSASQEKVREEPITKTDETKAEISAV